MVALPEGFPWGVCEPILGPFPRGNPEALRAGGDAWERAARRCLSEAEGLEGVASSVPGCSTGDTAAEAQRALVGAAVQKRDLAVYCESKAVECRETANAIELGQFTWIVMGSALVVELLASLAMPVGGMAAAAGVRAAARKGWQLAWLQLIESVMALCARLSASRAALIGQGIVVGGVFGGGVTWAGQVWQQHRGDRDRIDWETVTVSGAGGSAGGLGAGVLYTRPVAGALARLQATGTRGADAMAMLLAGGAAGVAGGVTGTLGGAVAASAYRGDPAIPAGSEFYLGAVSGALEGLLSGGVHTVGHSAIPPQPPAGLLGRTARPPKPGDLAEIFTRDLNSRASGPSGGAHSPGTAATGPTHSPSEPADRSPTGPASPVQPVAESGAGAAETTTDRDPAAATTDQLSPGDRSATVPSPEHTTPGATAEAGTTVYPGVDSHPRPAMHGDPAGHSAPTTPARAGSRSTPLDIATTPDDVPRQAVSAPITTPPRLASPWHSPGTSPYPAVLAGSGNSTDGGSAERIDPGRAGPVAGREQPMVVPDDSDARRPGDAPAGPANPARERDDGGPLFGQEPPRVQGTADIHEPVARQEGDPSPPVPGETPPADERGWRHRRIEDESELARMLYHRPETRQVVIAVIDRLREVLSALHPQATREQVDNAFYTPEETISGGMVLRSVPLDELRRDGNLRELMAAVQNAMWRSRELPNPSGTTLDDGLSRLLNQPDWNERAQRLGLNADALNRLRETITGGDPDVPIVAADLRQGRNAMSDPGFLAIREEITHSGADRMLREIPEQARLSLTVQDWSLLGMPLSVRELEAIPGGLVALRKTRLDPHLPLPRDTRGHVDVRTLETRLAAEDSAFRNVIPLYRYDEHGRRLRDESGHAVVDSILAYHEEGPVDAATALRLDPQRFAVPLPWRPGAARFEFESDSEWFRQAAVERGVPVVSGVSGTAARIASKFIWIMPADVSKLDFAGAILSILLPAHHSLYETVGGLAMVGLLDAAIFRASDSTVADLYEAVSGLFGLPERDGLSGHGRENGQLTGPIGVSDSTGTPAANTSDTATEAAPAGPEKPVRRPPRLREEVESARVLYHRPERGVGAKPAGLHDVLAAGDPGDPGRDPHSRSGAHYATTEPELLPRTGEFELNDRRIRSILDGEVKPALLDDRPGRPLKQVEEPVLYVVGGQPGAGKSTLVDSICDRLADRGGAALIQADELEKFHPAYSRLYQENDFTAHDYLVPTAQKLRNMFEEFLIPLPYNVLLEGGNSDPRGTLARIRRIAGNRSRTIMEVIALPKEQSDLARLERFVYGREADGFGRYLTRRTHDRLYLGCSELVGLVESAKPVPVDLLRIRTRTDLLYENCRSSDGQWHDPPRARAALEDERNREWTREECRSFEERIARLNELVNSRVAQDPARWAPLVHEIDGLRVLAEPKLSRPAT